MLTCLVAVLRFLAEGKIGWGFWPPNTSREVIDSQVKNGNGIWIPYGEEGGTYVLNDNDEDSDLEAEEDTDVEESEEDQEETLFDDKAVQSDAEESPKVAVVKSRFAALTLHVDEREDEEETSDEGA